MEYNPNRITPPLYLLPNAALAEPAMEKINPFLFYQLGSALGAIKQLKDVPGQKGTPMLDAHIVLMIAESNLESLLKDEKLKLRASIRKAADTLLSFVKVNRIYTLEASNLDTLDGLRVSTLKGSLAALEHILMAELPMLDLYIVGQKGAFDTAKLIDEGETIVCTYTNTKQASVRIEKVSLGGTGTFSFTDTVPSGPTSIRQMPRP